MGITREYSRRVKLSQYNTIDDAVELLKKSENIIVLTGAGVSTLMRLFMGRESNHTDIEAPRYLLVLEFPTSVRKIPAYTQS